MSDQVQTTLDPLNKFTKYKAYEIADVCGILPIWVLNYNFFDKPLKDALKIQYGFPFGDDDMSNFTGNVEADGTFTYPEDPTKYPLIRIVRGSETFYQYLDSWVAIVQEDGSFYVDRMD